MHWSAYTINCSIAVTHCLFCQLHVVMTCPDKHNACLQAELYTVEQTHA